VIALGDVQQAARRIDGQAHRTPVIRSATLDELAGARVHLKAECLQRAGAFKFRGAYNKLATLPRGRDVIAYSSGNHAQAVALAARLQGRRATILMPADAPVAKLEATRGYGGEVISFERSSDDREAIASALAAERGLELVRPYDDPLVMAGQGTTALELLEQVADLDVVVVPVGGGGLLAGCATVVKALRPGIRIVGVEPEAGNDTALSLAGGARVNVGVPSTICDGLGASEPGMITFEVNRRLVDEIVTVSDEEVVAAMAFLFERIKLVSEPSGAVGVAALMSGRIGPPTGPVGVVVSGGNVGAAQFAELIGAEHAAALPN
jgi:threonine dehydratase